MIITISTLRMLAARDHQEQDRQEQDHKFLGDGAVTIDGGDVNVVSNNNETH